MMKLLQRLQDLYCIARDNLINYMNEDLNLTSIPRDAEGVRAAERRQDERRYQSMRTEFDRISEAYGGLI